MTTICKTILTGTSPQQIREQTEGLAPARLRDLAARLAARRDLTVSVITYDDDGAQELEVLHTGPPHRTEHTIDCRKFTRQPGPPGWTLSIAGQSGLHDAVRLIHQTLVNAAAP